MIYIFFGKMPKEKQVNSASTISIQLRVNRASLGKAEHVFVFMKSIDDVPDLPFYAPRRLITINEQPLRAELSARLKADVVEVFEDGFLVETMDSQGEKVRFRINGEGRLVPSRYEPVFAA